MPEDSKPPSSFPDVEELKKQIGQLLIGWGAPGLGIGLAVHFLRESKWGEAAIVTLASIAVWLLIKFFNQLDPRLNKLFEWLVNQLENAIIRLWWQLTSQFQGKYYQSLIYTYRDYRTQGLKTKGPFALDLEKVFVPLQVAPEVADNISSMMLQVKEIRGNLSIWDFLTKISEHSAFKRIVIIAPPGSGKTTLLEHLTLTYARTAQRRYDRRAPKLIPVLLYLRDVKETIAQATPPTLADLITQHPNIQPLNPPPGWFANKLRQGKCLVMLDGLDEVADTTQRQQVSQWVDQQMKHYPNATFILTSRPFGYRSAPLEQVGAVIEVQPFTLEQMQQFIQNWYLQNEIMSRLGKDDPGVRQLARQKAGDLIDRIQYNPSLAAMALNPLLLTMIATVHSYRGALPGRRVELYAEICDVLLGRRQEAKGIPDRLSAVQKKSVLQVLALKGMQRKTREFKVVTACMLIRQRLVTVAGTEADPELFLKQIENVSGLLVEREPDVYEFAHKSFQEYLAAAQVKDLNQDFLLTKHIDDPWWDETIRLYAAQSDASNLIWAALQQSNVVALTLAYDCLEEGLSVQPDVRRELNDRLEAGLESTNPEIFKLAAEVKLSRRLNRLLRIDDTTEIDTHYISCAEYQLFIDDKRQAGENLQPDHWLTDRFTRGGANQPITGVRASDAEAFCNWLTQRTGSLGDIYLEANSPVFVGNTKFRLPTTIEVDEYPTPQKHIGCWCNARGKKVIAGVATEQWQVWQKNLVALFDFNHDLDLIIDHVRSQNPDQNYNSVFDLIRNNLYDLIDNGKLVSEPGFDRSHDLDRGYDQVLNLDLGLNHFRDLEQFHAHDASLDLVIELVFDQVRDRDLELVTLFNFDRIRSRVSKHDLSYIRSYLVLIAILCNLVSKTYDEASKDRRIIQNKTLTRQNCKTISHDYALKRDQAFNLYAFFVLIDERRQGNMPAWEGIRIVRERITA